LDGERFDAETTRLLGIAFETAIQALHNWGVIDSPREALATTIIGFAKAGERDPDRLCDAAVERHVADFLSATPFLFRRRRFLLLSPPVSGPSIAIFPGQPLTTASRAA